MTTYRLLILTDHSGHSAENSLYALGRAMQANSHCDQADVASRALPENAAFFQHKPSREIYASPVTGDFSFSPDGETFRSGLRPVQLTDYDLVWLRLPPPLTKEFLTFLRQQLPNTIIYNDPAGIWMTGSKAFLTHFPEVCPPMRLCRTREDILAFSRQFPIVLKPFRDYGGRGIVRIDGEQVQTGGEELSLMHFLDTLPDGTLDYLGVRFLTQVTQGDKRIIVVDGKVMGASLRLPPEGSWICNVAMGGRSVTTSVTEAEMAIIRQVNPLLSKHGIVMYGIDTLVDDDGQRVLSEINTSSIGGLPQIAIQQQLPLVEQATDLIWQRFVRDSIVSKEA